MSEGSDPEATAPVASIDAFGLSDVGKARRRNEDSYLVAELRKAMLVRQTNLTYEDQEPLLGEASGELLVVADGMGGQVAGDRASKLAVKTVNQYVLHAMPWFLGLAESTESQLEQELVQAVRRCQEVMEAELEADAGREGMGTTVTLAYIAWPAMYVVHVGDSRCYVLRDGHLHQITHDDTYAQALVDQGVMDPETADHSALAHMLSQAIIAKEGSDMTPSVYRTTLELGDGILLCSDGLSKHVSNARIAELLEEADTSEEACRQLVREANDGGGTDNVTVVVARCSAGD